ncbi:MAG: DUF1700 domain-containing protein [Lachnospiraceae bacterium]|nr:DUF1700 domain-containing protein [Lachnospiraceae bacterium]
MTRYEFLNELKTTLSGNVSDSVLNENLEYYDEYIASEIRSGKSEEEILKSLGEPRLIARTIIDTSDPNLATGNYASESWEESSEKDESRKKNSSEKKRRKSSGKPGFKFYMILALLLILVLLIIGLFVSAMGVLLYIFWPAALVLFLIYMLTRNIGHR